jgi:hypothetical protein
VRLANAESKHIADMLGSVEAYIIQVEAPMLFPQSPILLKIINIFEVKELTQRYMGVFEDDLQDISGLLVHYNLRSQIFLLIIQTYKFQVFIKIKSLYTLKNRE